MCYKEGVFLFWCFLPLILVRKKLLLHENGKLLCLGIYFWCSNAVAGCAEIDTINASVCLFLLKTISREKTESNISENLNLPFSS